MTIQTLLGNYWFSAVLVIMAMALVFVLYLVQILAALFCRVLYQAVFRKEFDPSYEPRCAVVLPCKGICKDFEKNLEDYCRLDYKKYQLIISVESEADSAVPIIRKVAGKYPFVSLVVAGLTTACSQKNHNMLAAVRSADNPDVYVFGDADIPPRPDWLRELVLPLSSKSITTTTGFRWLLPPKGTVGELSHANVNLFFLTLFGTTSLLKIGSIVWGGTMAIRKKDFEDLKVADMWSRTGVDDISLAAVLARNGRRSMLVPACVTPTTDLIETTAGTIRWTTRQAMYLKAYHRPLWLFGLGYLWISAIALYLWLPVSLLWALSSKETFFSVGGGASLVWIFGDMVGVILYRLLGKMPGFWRLPLLQPVLRFTHIIAYWNTLFSRKITWSGVRYTLDYHGMVTKVERL